MKSFREFYQYYLDQHQSLGSRIFHFLAVFFTLWVLIYVIATERNRFFWYLPLTMILLPLLGNLLFERKKQFTEFKNPLFSIMSDFNLFFDLLIGKQKFRKKVDKIIR